MGSGSSFKKQEDPEPGFFSLCPDLISSRWIPDPLLPYSVAYPDPDFFYPDGIRIRFYKARGSGTIFFLFGSGSTFAMVVRRSCSDFFLVDSVSPFTRQGCVTGSGFLSRWDPVPVLQRKRIRIRVFSGRVHI